MGSMVGRYVRPASRNRASILSRPTVELGRLRAGFDAAYSNADRPGAVQKIDLLRGAPSQSPASGRSVDLRAAVQRRFRVVGLSDRERLMADRHLLDDLELGGMSNPTSACYAHAWEAGDLVIWALAANIWVVGLSDLRLASPRRRWAESSNGVSCITRIYLGDTEPVADVRDTRPRGDCVSQERADILHLVELPNGFDQTLGPRASGHAFGQVPELCLDLGVGKGTVVGTSSALHKYLVRPPVVEGDIDPGIRYRHARDDGQ